MPGWSWVLVVRVRAARARATPYGLYAARSRRVGCAVCECDGAVVSTGARRTRGSTSRRIMFRSRVRGSGSAIAATEATRWSGVSGSEDAVGACCERPAPEAYASRAAGAEVDGVVFRTRQTVGCLNRDDLELFLEAALPASLQQGLDAFFNTACGRLQQSVMDVDGAPVAGHGAGEGGDDLGRERVVEDRLPLGLGDRIQGRGDAPGLDVVPEPPDADETVR